MKPGDVIVKLGDKTIGRSAELNAAAALPPGQKAPLRLIRNRAPVMLTITGADEAAGNAGLLSPWPRRRRPRPAAGQRLPTAATASG